jgi:hypothetical protein
MNKESLEFALIVAMMPPGFILELPVTKSVFDWVVDARTNNELVSSRILRHFTGCDVIPVDNPKAEDTIEACASFHIARWTLITKVWDVLEPEAIRHGLLPQVGANMHGYLLTMMTYEYTTEYNRIVRLNKPRTIRAVNNNIYESLHYNGLVVDKQRIPGGIKNKIDKHWSKEISPLQQLLFQVADEQALHNRGVRDSLNYTYATLRTFLEAAKDFTHHQNEKRPRKRKG